MTAALSGDQIDRLAGIYFRVKQYPGWLAGLRTSWQLSTPEVEFLEQLDDAYLATDKAVAAFAKESRVERSFGIFGVETDERKIALLSESIAAAYGAYQDSADRDEPYFQRVFLLLMHAVEPQEKMRRRLRAQMVYRSRPADGLPADRITDQDIERARAFPLEDLVGPLNAHGYMRCPFHDDTKPSFLVKNGYGYCFSCQAWADSLKWMMEIRRFNFIDAVRALCRR